MELFFIIYAIVLFSLPLFLFFSIAGLIFAIYDFTTSRPRTDLFKN